MWVAFMWATVTELPGNFLPLLPRGPRSRPRLPEPPPLPAQLRELLSWRRRSDLKRVSGADGDPTAGSVPVGFALRVEIPSWFSDEPGTWE